MTIAVGYVHPGVVHHAFMHSFLRLVSTYPTEIDGRIAVQSGPLLASARNDVVRAFLEGSTAEHLLFLDTDISFDPDVPMKLRERKRPIVSALYNVLDVNQMKPRACAIEDVGGELRLFPETLDNIGLVEVAGVGMGCCLIAREVLESFDHPEPYPFFQETVRDGQGVGEDTEFCLRAKDKGFGTFLDTSVRVGHLKTVQV